VYYKFLPNLVLKPSQAGNQRLGNGAEPLIAAKPRLQATATPSRAVATLIPITDRLSKDASEDQNLGVLGTPQR
jgi:hypothetical protein